MRLFLCCMLLACVLASCTDAGAPASAPVSPDVTLARAPVPFNGSLTGTAVTVGHCALPTPSLLVLSLNLSLSGNVTHMGLTGVTAALCVNWPTTPPYAGSASGTMVFTAANGDKAYGTTTITFAVSGVTNNITGSFDIVGGTGRFLNATGSGTFSGAEDLSGGLAPGIQHASTMSFTGTIQY